MYEFKNKMYLRYPKCEMQNPAVLIKYLILDVNENLIQTVQYSKCVTDFKNWIPCLHIVSYIKFLFCK